MQNVQQPNSCYETTVLIVNAFVGMRDFKKLCFKIYIFSHSISCAVGLDFILTGHQGFNILTAGASART